ncbi:unnamed protein product [Penicillium salamii]|nr:unnamed protein product [Penicillium salamii]CAG8147944.1 unnamed protein product [Penicillium salamii]CAG8428908.1 unnamed protein product [Penicillium salamii]
METLSDTTWDVIIQGTGFCQSLLALALSRSGKKVLHMDSNQYYGGPDAAFSFDEAQEWVTEVTQDRHPLFRDASVLTPQEILDLFPPTESSETPKLASSRAYTLSLSPCFLHARSELMSALVSSKVFRQLEFMAVGSWWIYTPEKSGSGSGEPGAEKTFHRVPGNREDVFAASHISMKSKRTLMRLLRHITKSSEDEGPSEDEDLSMPFKDYLTSKFSVPPELHDPLLSLSLSQQTQQDTPASYAIPKIQRHLASIGYLGPGFGAVIAKYGGAPEILQAACRASAVGGSIYALGTKVVDCKWRETPEHSENPFLVTLKNEGDVQSKLFFSASQSGDSESLIEVARSVSVLSGTFSSLFPIAVEGAPLPATAVLMFPGNTLGMPESPSVYLQVHSSDTGECPHQQSVVYCSVALPGTEGQSLLQIALERLIATETSVRVLWSMRYTQRGRSSTDGTQWPLQEESCPGSYLFPPPSLDFAFEDDTLGIVKEAWKKVVGDDIDHDFMMFDDREGTHDNDSFLAMPLDSVTGLAGQLPVNQVESTTRGVTKNVPTKQLNQTTKDLTDPVIPGEFPSDDAPQKGQGVDNNLSFSSIWTTMTNWFSTLFPQAFDYFESLVQKLVAWLLPPPRQAAMYEAALKRPAATTFLVCQAICCGVPLLVFLAGVFVFAAVSILLWAVLSLLILGPVLLVTSMMGVSLWGWGWVLYGLVKWVDQRFLGGIITRFWLTHSPPDEEDEGQSEEQKKED